MASDLAVACGRGVLAGIALGAQAQNLVSPTQVKNAAVEDASDTAPPPAPGAEPIRRLARTTLDGALLPRASDLNAGDRRAPVYVFMYGDPTLPKAAEFFGKDYADLKATRIDTGQVMFIYRPLPITSLASMTTLVLRCMPRDEVFPFLQAMANKDMSWGLRPYTEAMDLMKEVAANHKFPPALFDRCLQRIELSNAVHDDLARDISQIRFRDMTGDLTFYVNGGYWYGYDMYPYVKTNIKVAVRERRDFGETNPAFALHPMDRVLGNPNAPYKIYEYASIVFAHHMPLHRDGMDPRLKELLRAGQVAYVYRPYHYFNPDARAAAIAASCVPAERFWDFWDHTARTNEFWYPLGDRAESIEKIAKNFGANELCFREKRAAEYVDQATKVGLEQFDVIRISSFYYRGVQLRGNIGFELLGSFIREVDVGRAEGRSFEPAVAAAPPSPMAPAQAPKAPLVSPTQPTKGAAR